MGTMMDQVPNTTLTAYDHYRSVRFFGSLNGLRCLCIGMVLWHHSPLLGSLEAPPKFLTRGFLGVDFFFVLSGFLITTLLLREESRTRAISLKDFYLRRALRIIPAYFLLVTAMSLYWVWYKGMDELAPLVPYYYLFLANMLIGDIPMLTVTWSLSVEEQYYLVWPLLLSLLAPRLRIPALLLLLGLCVATATGVMAAMGFSPIRSEHAVWALPAASFGAILCGTLTAVLLHDPRGFRMLYALCGARIAPACLFAALVVVLAVLPADLTGLPFLLVHLTMAFCLAALVVREDHRLAPLFSWAPVARIGEISYGIYLYHLIARHVGVEGAAVLGLPPALAETIATAIFVAGAILIAEISFRTLERFFLSLKPGPKVRRGDRPAAR
ncbi:acyltransferase family protein [Seohaeicola nanhaiensis]|uniref:Acyltransferase family protein n=1 Tax=Seohaeicola nanhaiensis TaxID=1387282 RepID=A0ABV9KLL4_9RHOB